MSVDQLVQKQDLLDSVRSAEHREENFHKILDLYHSSESSDAQVAGAALRELAISGDPDESVTAIAYLASKPTEEAKELLIQLVLRKDARSVQAAAKSLRRQHLTAEEAQLLLQAAKGIDQRVIPSRVMHGPGIEGDLLSSIAASRGQSIFPDLIAYLDSPEATPGLYDYRPSILGAFNSDEARRILRQELKDLDLSLGPRAVPWIVILGGSLANGIKSGSLRDSKLLDEYIDLVVAAVGSEKTHPRVKDVAYESIARLVDTGVGHRESRLRVLLAGRRSDDRKSHPTP